MIGAKLERASVLSSTLVRIDAIAFHPLRPVRGQFTQRHIADRGSRWRPNWSVVGGHAAWRRSGQRSNTLSMAPSLAPASLLRSGWSYPP